MSGAGSIAKPATVFRLRRHAPLAIGLTLILLLTTIALVSLVWTPFPPSKMQIMQKLKPPFEVGLLGTDQYGRDVLSLLMAGAWNSLSIALFAVTLGATIGVIIGLAAAAWQGLLETVTMRGCDVIFAVPPILSAMMLGAFIGPGRWTAILAIATFMVPVFTRITVGAARQIWTRDFILAARAAGKGPLLISWQHVLPNIIGPIIVQVTIQLGLAILTEAGLSFLGLGLPPPAPSWGRMLAESQTFLRAAPWLAILPGLAVALSVLGFNLIGDGLRDRLDPRQRGRI
ncbi:ABC transporter permease [Rhizobium sp. LjRoot30]|uniref:ABC transporter permease n=1 Tax=Rhizobium sp. LjRoot30 TaxID=3342320 RepID=UPI003ECC5FDD